MTSFIQFAGGFSIDKKWPSSGPPHSRPEPNLVSKRVDHARISTTGDVYRHLLPGWQKEAANAFSTAMKEG